jgi:hypothetical protein
MRITLSAGMRFVAFPALVVGLTALAAPRSLSAQSIKPGQSEADVRAAWGEPLTVRKIGDYSYMFYTNGCLKTCGTYDVVILEKDQVVDAIVRAQGRSYEGVSSSPPDRKPEPTNVAPTAP